MPKRNYKNKKSKRIILTFQEKSELFTEGIITIILLSLLGIALLVILKQMIKNNLYINDLIFEVKQVLWNKFHISLLLSWKYIVITVFLLLSFFVTTWRIARRYKQFQLWHIMSELHYIAAGHYDHQVEFQLNGDLKSIIDSINELVASTKHAIEEEQLIKQSKDDLITNVSHDIRTPLTSIIGYLQLIENNQYQSEQELKEYVSIAYHKAKEMKIMVDDLFEYSVLDHPTTDLNLSRFDLSELIQQISVSYLHDFERKNIQLLTNVTPQHLWITADADKIVRVFNNLLSNALKYGEDATIIEINAKIQEQEVLIVVRNNGEAISDEVIDKIFERFYRGDTSRNQKIQGTGLGLAIVQSIIELHNGTIKVQSNEKWTTFSIQLPIKQEGKS